MFEPCILSVINDHIKINVVICKDVDLLRDKLRLVAPGRSSGPLQAGGLDDNNGCMPPQSNH